MARRWQIQIESNGNLLTLGTKNKGFFVCETDLLAAIDRIVSSSGGNHGRWRNYSSNRAHGPFSSRVTSKGITELELSKLGIFSANKRNRCSFSLTAHVAASGKFSYGAVKQTVVLPLDYKKRHVLLFDGATRLSGSTGQEIYFFFARYEKVGKRTKCSRTQSLWRSDVAGPTWSLESKGTLVLYGEFQVHRFRVRSFLLFLGRGPPRGRRYRQKSASSENQIFDALTPSSTRKERLQNDGCNRVNVVDSR